VGTRERIELAAGWAEWDRDSFVRVGARAVPQRIDVTFPSSPDGWPSLHLTIEVRRGSPQCTELTIRSDPEGREVRGVDYRAVKLEEWVDEICALASMDVVKTKDGGTVFRASVHRSLRTARGETVDASLPELARMLDDESGEEEFRRDRKAIAVARSGARRTVTDELLRSVAKVYRDNITDRPVEHVRAAFRPASYRTAARYVQLARAKGFLPKTKQGKVSG